MLSEKIAKVNAEREARALSIAQALFRASKGNVGEALIAAEDSIKDIWIRGRVFQHLTSVRKGLS